MIVTATTDDDDIEENYTPNRILEQDLAFSLSPSSLGVYSWKNTPENIDHQTKRSSRVFISNPKYVPKRSFFYSSNIRSHLAR